MKTQNIDYENFKKVVFFETRDGVLGMTIGLKVWLWLGDHWRIY